MKLYIILLLILSISLPSCETEAQLDYKITNNTTATIKVICTNTDGTITTDTFTIGVNQQTTIAVNGQGLSRVSNYKETSDNLRDFTRMDIFKNDTFQSTTDFLKTNRWIYKETDTHIADYILTVIDSDF